VEAGAASIYATVSGKRVSGSDPGGQWYGLWIGRAGGVVAIECLVDGFGDTRGVYRARPSGAERGARANASGAEGRNDASDIAQFESSTTTTQPLGRHLQPNSSASEFGAAATSGTLPAQPFGCSHYPTDLSKALARQKSANQWGDQMLWSQAVYRRSIRRPSGWIETIGSRKFHSVFFQCVDWPIVGFGPDRNASGQLHQTFLMKLSRGANAKKAKRFFWPAPHWPRLRSGSLRSPPRSRGQRGALSRFEPPHHKLHEKCYPCLCPKCYPCVCPVPTPALSPKERVNRSPVSQQPYRLVSEFATA